jgi:hypothetical protein
VAQWNVFGRNVATSTARVVAQQRFSFCLFSLRFHSRQENLGARNKNVVIPSDFLLFL